MRIEVMVDKEQKIYQATLMPWKPSFTEICALCTRKLQYVSVKAEPMVLN